MDKVLAYATVALAVGTFLLAAGTVWLALEARSGSYRQIRVQTWLEIMKRFDSPEMIRARKDLARKIQESSEHDSISETVISLFDDVGVLYKLNLIDKNLATSRLGFYASRWWTATRDYILKERKRHNNDNTIFEDFQNLAEQVRLPKEKIDDKELKHFLEDEARLVID